MQNQPNKLKTEDSRYRETPEYRLWKSVFTTAIKDALHTTPKKKKGVKYKVFTEEMDVKSARNWFIDKEETFSTACEALDLDEDQVHKRMYSRIRTKQFLERLGKL